MQEQLAILIHQLILFSTFILVGFIFQQLKMFTESAVMGLSQVVVKVLLPLMILTTLAGSGGTLEDIKNLLPFALGVLIMYGVLFGLGFLTAGLMRLPQPTRNVHLAMSGFTNSGFMGLPLLLAMFPKEAALAFVPYGFIETILLWGRLKNLTELPAAEKQPFSWKKVFSPVTIAMIVGILLMVLGIQPRGAVWEGLTALGGTCKYMALLYIGGIIGVKGLRNLFRRKEAFSLVVPKLLIAPLLVFFIVRALGLLNTNYLVILTTYASLPCMVMTAILAETNGSDGDYAVSALLYTTICSLFTMPFVLWLLTKFIA